MSSNDDLTSIFKLIESSEKILEDRKGFLSEGKSLDEMVLLIQKFWTNPID